MKKDGPAETHFVAEERRCHWTPALEVARRSSVAAASADGRASAALLLAGFSLGVALVVLAVACGWLP